MRVTPLAKKERVEKVSGGFKVYVCAPASEGKANKRLEKVLSAYLKVKKSSIKILKGAKSRNKVVEIR